MAKVFIGSTSRDLHAHRQAAIDECNRLGLVPVAMEFFEAIGAGATAGSRRKLDEADVYVGIFAHRYGFVEPGEAASVTEIEFDYAADPRQLERLCFLVDPENGDPGLLEHAEPERRQRVADFRARIEGSVIRQYFTSVDDFRGKVRLALQAWMHRTPALRGPQPPLSFQLLEPTVENRLRYGARRTPLVGRARELECLRAFLREPAGFSWLTVAGPPGAGKSRLVQELCTEVSPPWRAGFLLTDPPFTAWTDWRPEGPTLIAIDYASEQVDPIRELFNAVIHRGADAFARTPLRVILVERDADGEWMQRLVGIRSTGYALEQARSSQRTIELGPLSDGELWQSVESILGDRAGRPRVREELIAALGLLDPQRRPLFALLAADALAAGRHIAAWDRERLLRDVLARERATWAAHGVTREYENLLALATMTGGLTEEVLDAPPAGMTLPAFRDFDRRVYRTMTGADLEGDALPPLKPDVVGEFFVLEHVRGRNDRVTAQAAAELRDAAWRVRGGSRRITQFDVLTRLLPANLPIFLRRMVDDYVDHPATPHMLARPSGEDIDLFFWPELAAYGIRQLAAAGRMREAMERFHELTGLSPEQRRALHGTGSIVAATLALLPRALAPGSPVDAADLVASVDTLELESHDTAAAFADGVADAVPGLIAAGRRDLAGAMLERLHAAIGKYPDEPEIRVSYCRGLSPMVTAGGQLPPRERSFETMQEFCYEFRHEVRLFVWLALAAGSLCHEYVADRKRLDDAERMNRTVRALVRLRSEQRVIRFADTPEEPFPVRAEVIQDDLRTMQLELAATNAALIPGLVLAGRDAEGSALLDEIERISPRGDADFAAMWAFGAARHAYACTADGRYGQVPKALAAIGEVTAAISGDLRFRRIAGWLALNTLKRAGGANGPLVRELYEFLGQAAEGSADPELIADFAEATLVVCSWRQESGELGEARRVAAAAASALRSPAARARWLERGNETTAAEIERWTEHILGG